MHWHIDIAVIIIARVHCYMCSLLYSRSVVHQEFLDCMTEADIELILQRGLDAHPLLARPRRSARILSTDLDHSSPHAAQARRCTGCYESCGCRSSAGSRC